MTHQITEATELALMEYAFYPVKGIEDLSALMEFFYARQILFFFKMDGERPMSQARYTLFIQKHGHILVRRDSSDWLEAVNSLFEEFIHTTLHA